ncbi:hypothetical protein Q1695_012337 [Nippostrongylus brasiliensis]|nr:hypothetical protein Q1695_012337 [Nippostrongylus brasiliensis]
MSERHGIIPGRMHSNDIISVEARVARNDYEDGIKYYRGHSDETGDGFAMVIITPTQQQWLQKYGRTGVCIDDTFNLTGYNLRVAVVVLVNEWDMGVPGGYLLSFRMTAKEVRVLFAEVRKVVPDFEPAFFMSDDTNTFYNGFVQEFPETQSSYHTPRPTEMRRRLSYGRHRFAEQLNAHKAGMKALHDAQLQVLVTDKGWEVRSGRTYFIEQKQCECDPALNNHCTRDGCGACAYAYCCTCSGDGKAGVCCLHIHAAIVAHPEGRQFRFPPEDGNDNIHSACDVDVNNNLDVDNFVVEPEVDIVGNSKENVEETDRMDQNKDNIQRIEMLCSQIKSISPEIAKKPDACDVLDDVVVNMQQIYQQLAARTEQRAPLNRRFELNTVGPIKKDVPIRLLSRKAAKKSNHDLSSSY